MLIRFRVENHRSIRDEQELSLVASPLSEHPGSLVRAERYDLDLLRVAAVYGANASGKSTLFDALSFMRSAVLDSHRAWKPDDGIPRAPFALDPEVAAKPTLFAVDVLIGEVRYEYGFLVDSVRVLEEWLYAYPKGRRQEWFTRDVEREEEFAFSRLLPGENRLISTLTRPNSLFLSAAVQTNHESFVPIYNWFSQRLRIIDDRNRSFLYEFTSSKCSDSGFKASVLSILTAADTGVSDIEVVEEDPATMMTRVFQYGTGLPRNDERIEVDRHMGVQLRHSSGGTGLDVPLSFHYESQGTRSLFSLAGFIVDALVSGGCLMVDELDRSLHTHLASRLVDLFNNSETNPQNAQLVFNTHDTNLLDTRILRRDQIWFTEKGDDGATRLFPLTDFRARKYENIERGYLQGRYGAVPSVRTPDLRRVSEG